jgi:hypothetical protein|mmetsp:Transcript_44072/g.58485  ORF Transcript_44072/g.58485 Transcript_44072/m.58485 type:complete len:101 (+) Transcript_44072:1074-1376(+)
MEDENPMFRTNTHFANVADDDSVREAQAKWEEEQKMTAEERARRKFEESLEEEDDAPNAAAAAAAKEQESSGDAASTDADSEDLLDKLTGNTDEGDDDEA